MSVELQELLAAPLFGPEGDAWKQEQRQMPEEYEKWVDAQLFSEKASNLYANFKDIIFPLEKTRRPNVLDDMWKQINNVSFLCTTRQDILTINVHQNYVSVSGEDIDTLWQLQGALDYAPQWSASWLPNISEESDDELPQRSRGKQGKKQAKRLALTNGGDSDSNGSMPGLQSVSNTSDDDDFDTSDSESEAEDEESDDDDDSGYNTEEEDEMREMYREAMDAAHEADWFDASASAPAGIDPFAEDERKGNPFLKLLGSLRGMLPCSAGNKS